MRGILIYPISKHHFQRRDETSYQRNARLLHQSLSQKRLNGKTCGQVRKESLEQNEFTQYPIIPARRYVRYWNEIESKKKHQKEIIIEEIKNNPNQIGMGC